jgi:hypothetical protein
MAAMPRQLLVGRKAAYAKPADENVIYCKNVKSGSLRPVPYGSGNIIFLVQPMPDG